MKLVRTRCFVGSLSDIQSALLAGRPLWVTQWSLGAQYSAVRRRESMPGCRSVVHLARRQVRI